MAVYKRGRVWWYKFTWKGEPIRESTKQTNKRVAERIEAAHKTSLAKGEVGISDRKPAATIRQFAIRDFLPFCPSSFASKTKTLSYYENGAARCSNMPQSQTNRSIRSRPRRLQASPGTGRMLE